MNSWQNPSRHTPEKSHLLCMLNRKHKDISKYFPYCLSNQIRVQLFFPCIKVILWIRNHFQKDNWKLNHATISSINNERVFRVETLHGRGTGWSATLLEKYYCSTIAGHIQLRKEWGTIMVLRQVEVCCLVDTNPSCPSTSHFVQWTHIGSSKKYILLYCLLNEYLLNIHLKVSSVN